MSFSTHLPTRGLMNHVQRYELTSEIISSLLEYFTASESIFEIYLKDIRIKECRCRTFRSPAEGKGNESVATKLEIKSKQLLNVIA